MAFKRSYPKKKWGAKKRAVRGRPRMYRRKPVSVRTSVIKRMGTPVVLDNGGAQGFARLLRDGNGSMSIGTTQLGTFFNSSQVGLAQTFQLTSIPDYTDFTQLFDRYKITGVKLQFLYQSNVSIESRTDYPNQSIPTASVLPLLTSAYDFDDSNVPVVYSQVQNKSYAKKRILNGNREWSMYIKPRQTLAVQSAGGIALTSDRPHWIDSNSASVTHYGMKYWLDCLPLGKVDGESIYPTVQLTITPTYYLALRDPQ